MKRMRGGKKVESAASCRLAWSFRTKEVTGQSSFAIKGESHNSASCWGVIMFILSSARSCVRWEAGQTQNTYHCWESPGMLVGWVVLQKRGRCESEWKSLKRSGGSVCYRFTKHLWEQRHLSVKCAPGNTLLTPPQSKVLQDSGKFTVCISNAIKIEAFRVWHLNPQTHCIETTYKRTRKHKRNWNTN